MKLRIALSALVLLVAACGDDDSTASTAAPSSTTAATTAAPDTTEAATTTAAPTTTEAPTTTADPFAAIAMQVAEYEGGYEGTWNNTTFGSEGAFIGDIAFDPDSQTVTLTLDLGGFVFGAFDPEPETIVVPLADLALLDGEATITSATFGEMTATFGPDGLTLFGADVPDPGIATIAVTGSLTPAGFDLAYVIEFEGGGGAEGTVTASSTG